MGQFEQVKLDLYWGSIICFIFGLVCGLSVFCFVLCFVL